MTKSRGIRSPRRAWTPRELRLLRELYPDLLAGKVATELGRTVKQVYDMAHKLALGKSDAFKASEAAKLSVRARQRPEIVARHFAKGFTPWNKGLKGLQLGGVATQFKPGNPPHNRGPVGSYRVIGGHGTPLLERKMNDLPGPNHVRWHPVHRLVWEAAHGPVPKGSICVFKPGRRTTVLEEITLDRIEIITRAQNAARNHPRARSPELARLVQLKGAITRQVNRITREAAQQ